MSEEVVTLTSSDSEDDVCIRKDLYSGGKPDRNTKYPNSDDELMNLDLDSPGRGSAAEDDEICEIPNEDYDNNKASKNSPKLKISRSAVYQRSDVLPQQPAPKPHPIVESVPALKSNNNPPRKGRTKKNDNKLYEKAVKAAEAANKKTNKKAECLKFVTIVIDSHLLNVLPGSGNILVQLQEADMIHSIVATSFSKTVHWKREKMEYYATEEGQVASRSEMIEEDDGIVILTAEEFVTEATTTSMVHYLNNLMRKWKKTHLNLVIFGLSAYHKEQSLKEKRRFREQATGEKSHKSNSKQNQGETEPGLSFNEMEQLKVEIMVQTSCSIWPVESSDELGKVIARLTKAVAERPFKEDRLDQQFEFYADDYNGGIKVNKEGHGLERLWQQQLMQFPLVALETSQAIASRYPSPFSLHLAYSACNDENEAALLLQDIPIRRHAGPLSTARRVGPELSRKIHKFVTSKDGSLML